jgi:NAD(P)-dependent dehydrogenase (short-subunit alcohol dehydrogenase family)
LKRTGPFHREVKMSTADQTPGAGDVVCLVTGATRGLGRAVAEEMARQGATVIITGRDLDAVQVTVEEISAVGSAWALPTPLDVAVRSEVDAAATTIGEHFGTLDILINNAAAFVDWSESASAADLEQSRLVMETNLYGPWNMIQAFLPLLRMSSHPRVVNMGSGGGSHGDSQFGLSARHGAAASYGISKAALHALTVTLSTELAESPVVINAVDPNLTATWPGAESMGARPIEASVPGIVWAATLPDDGPRGGFFRDGQPHPW